MRNTLNVEKKIVIETTCPYFNNLTKLWEIWNIACYEDGSFDMAKNILLMGAPVDKYPDSVKSGNANDPFINKIVIKDQKDE